MPLAPSSPSHLLLTELAPMAAGGWHALGAEIFPGEVSLATGNSVYRFDDGVFLGRAKKLARSFDCPRSMRGMRLIGFLNAEGGLWSLSPRWRDGAHAVLWKPGVANEHAFIITSATHELTVEEPDPEEKPFYPNPRPSPWVGRAPSESGIMLRRSSRMPDARRPLPGSITRIHSAPAAAT